MPIRVSSEECRATSNPGDGFSSRRDPNDGNEELLDRAIEVFQPRTTRTLSRQDAREISHNLTGFFSVLLEWHHAEQAELAGRADSSDPSTPAMEE